jgi:hypothetical protein
MPSRIPSLFYRCHHHHHVAPLKDYRGSLFFEVTRLLHHHRPSAFLLENVPHLAEVDDGRALCGDLSPTLATNVPSNNVSHVAEIR